MMIFKCKNVPWTVTLCSKLSPQILSAETLSKKPTHLGPLPKISSRNPQSRTPSAMPIRLAKVPLFPQRYPENHINPLQVWTFDLCPNYVLSSVFFRVIISQVTTPSSPPAQNQKAQVLCLHVCHLLISSLPLPFFWRCWAKISLFVSAHNILETVKLIWHQLKMPWGTCSGCLTQLKQDETTPHAHTAVFFRRPPRESLCEEAVKRVPMQYVRSQALWLPKLCEIPLQFQ